jgi:sec-independent protein translocase protein TatC
MTDISKYLDFVLTMFLAFGITFEVPIVVILLVKTGLVSVAKLREVRPYMVVGAFVVGAIFTPPDVVSQTMLAVPLWLLYEIGIIVASLITRPPKPITEDAYSPMTDAEMEQELDNAEGGHRHDK